MTSPDLSEFFKYSRPKQKPCKVAFAVSNMSKGEVSQLEAALAQDRGLITNGAIRQWLNQRGHDVNDAAVTAHRRGVCSCGRD